MVMKIGSIVVATGYDHYSPKDGEYGFGNSDWVITLPEFKSWWIAQPVRYWSTKE